MTPAGGRPAGKPGRVRHRLQIAASFASAVIMLLVGIVSVYSLELAADFEGIVEHARGVDDSVTDVRTAAMRAHLAARAYVASDDTEALRRYRAATDELRSANEELSRLPLGFPAERSALDLLDERVDKLLTLLDQMIVGKQKGSPRIGEADVGSQMAAIDDVLDAAALLRRTVEGRHRSQRALLRSHLVVTEWVVAVGAGLSTAVALAAALALRRTLTLEREAERELSEHAWQLEAALEERARTLQELRDGERERERLIHQLERSNRDLDQFAYVTSHDLKAPLRGIANLASWIREDVPEEQLPAESRRHLELLQERVGRMEALIDAILQYSRAGRIRAEPETVDVGQLVHETIDLVATGDRVVFRVAEGLPEIITYRMILQQALLNLLANASKFADQADPRVRIDWRDAGAFVELTVGDNGEGIDPVCQTQIFKIFQTLGRDKYLEGTGIGLAVVKKTAEVVGGSVRVVSEPGDGATFVLRWPKDATKYDRVKQV